MEYPQLTKPLIYSYAIIVSILPLIFLLMKERTKKNNLIQVSLFTGVVLLYAPIYKAIGYVQYLLKIESIHSVWFASFGTILLGVLCFVLFRKSKRIEIPNYFRIRQNKQTLKKSVVVTIALLLISPLGYFLFPETELPEFQRTIYHLTLGPVEEEVLYRGVFLALLVPVFRHDLKIKLFKSLNIGNPVVLIIAVLFALFHAFYWTEENDLSFYTLRFFWTLIPGYVLTWVAFKNRSILIPILAHCVFNFILTCIFTYA